MLLAAGIVISTMIGPLNDGQTVRISRPGGGPPEVVRQVATAKTGVSGGMIAVPSNAVAGGGGVTVIGAEARAAEEAAMAATATVSEPRALYTEQLLRAFGYDRSNFGYSYINWPRGWGNRGGHRHEQPVAEIDPRVAATLRDAAPIESRFPPVPGR